MPSGSQAARQPGPGRHHTHRSGRGLTLTHSHIQASPNHTTPSVLVGSGKGMAKQLLFLSPGPYLPQTNPTQETDIPPPLYGGTLASDNLTLASDNLTSLPRMPKAMLFSKPTQIRHKAPRLRPWSCFRYKVHNERSTTNARPKIHFHFHFSDLTFSCKRTFPLPHTTVRALVAGSQVPTGQPAHDQNEPHEPKKTSKSPR